MLTTILVAGCLIVTSVARAQTATDNGNCTTVEECIPLLANNDDYAPHNWTRLIGGQNFTWCCTKAIADSLFIDADGWLAVKDDPPARHLNATLLKIVTDIGLFPCNADYDSGYTDGSPEINVNYTWLAATCPGWQLNQSEDLNVLQTISGFLLPAVIFCLSVPRRRKFHVFRAFFVGDLAGIKSYAPAFLGAIGAMVIVSLDTLLWLCVCFALAGPMILSGLYEAMLDNRVIDFVREKIENGRLTLDMRCRLLMMVLIGNLDLAIEDDPLVNQIDGYITISGTNANPSPSPAATNDPKSTSDGEETPVPPNSDRYTPDSHNDNVPVPMTRLINTNEAVGTIHRVPTPHEHDELGIRMGDGDRSGLDSGASEQRWPRPRTPQIRIDGAPVDAGGLKRRPTTNLGASPWRHMEELLYPIRLYDDEPHDRHLSPRQYPILMQRHGPECSREPCSNRDHFMQEQPHPRSDKTERQILKTMTRLRTMLNCQYSFGSMVGAPVLFFLGGFVFALLQSLQDLGNEDTALALAFGQWYMTIPHIAIISGLLLAGNNPNILEGVFATQRQDVEEPKRIMWLEFGLAYPSCYKVAWQWHRGHNKKRWIEMLISTYSTHDEARDLQSGYYEANQEDMETLRTRTALSPLDWSTLLAMSGLLLGVPFILAFLTAYFTPEIGVSCRSFTFLIYTSAEFGQIILWLWAYAAPPGLVKPRTDRRGPIGHTMAFGFFRRGGWLDRHGFYNPRSVEHFLHPGEPLNLQNLWRRFTSPQFLFDIRSLWCCVWYFFYVFLGIVAALAAIGGTLMQILGVYSADICYLTVEKWMHPFDPGNTALISSNSRSMIVDAQTFWKPCAITAIAFMSFVSFVGWWYQRRTRGVFMDLVTKIDHRSRGDTNEAKRKRAASTDENAGPRNLWGSPPM